MDWKFESRILDTKLPLILTGFLYSDKQFSVLFWAAAIQMFVYFSVWPALNDFRDVWQTAATCFQRRQQRLKSSCGVQCLGLQNTCLMFHKVLNKSLIKGFGCWGFFFPFTLHSRLDCPFPILRSLLNICLCYSLSCPLCLAQSHCPKPFSRSLCSSFICPFPGFLSHFQLKSSLPLPPEALCQDTASKQPVFSCCALAGLLKEHYTQCMVGNQNRYSSQG